MRNFLRRCIISLIGSDDKDIRVQQVAYNGKAEDAEIYAPYGMSYNLPPNCLCLYAQVGGDEGNLVILPDRSQDRVKDLKEGEVAFFNPLTKTRTIYRQDGNMEVVVTNNKVETVAGDVETEIGNNLNITVDGECNLTASSVNVDSPETNLGVGGPAIARVGDSVQVTVTSGSSAGTYNGTITSGGDNTSI